MLHLFTAKLRNAVQRLARKPGASVVNFHHIGSDNIYVNRLPITLSPQMFEERIAFLSSHFKVVPFSSLMKDRFNPKLAAVTFDDGYRSFMQNALPVLERYQCPAKLYLISEQVLGGLNWLNKLSAILCTLPKDTLIKFAAEALPSWNSSLPVSPPAFRKHFEYPVTLNVIDKYFSTLSPLPPWTDLYLNEADLKTLSTHPLLEWGSHSSQHLPLERLDPQQQSEQILVGHRQLHSILGNQLDGFALPFGKPELRQSSIAQIVSEIDQGFVTATDQRMSHQRIGSLYEVHRIKGESALSRIELLATGPK